MDYKLQKVESLIAEYYSISLSKKRIETIDLELGIETKTLKELKLIVDKEYSDILRLEQYSVIQLFVNILKDSTKQFEKERQEYLLAVLNLKECEKVIELLKYERQLLLNKVEDEDMLLKAINRELYHFDEFELFETSMYLSEFKSVNTELQKLIEYRLEVIETLDLAKELQESFIRMISYLTEAQSLNNWGQFYHEIKERKIKKKSYLDKAQSEIHHLQKSLLFLSNELLDVKEFQKEFKRTQAFVRGFNVKYYHDLINDWISDENLVETMSSTMFASKSINYLVQELEKMRLNIDEEYIIHQKRRCKLVEKITQN